MLNIRATRLTKEVLIGDDQPTILIDECISPARKKVKPVLLGKSRRARRAGCRFCSRCDAVCGIRGSVPNVVEKGIGISYFIGKQN